MAARLIQRMPAGTTDAEEHALGVLEFDQVLAHIASRATSAPGRRWVERLRPLKDPVKVDEALCATDEMVGLLLSADEWSPPPIPDAGPIIRHLETEGSVLDPPALHEIAELLVSSRRARAELRRLPEDRPLLAVIGGRLLRAPELETILRHTLEPGGTGVADGASTHLGKVRRTLRGARSAIVRRLETFVRSLPAHFQVPDASVTLRGGRYCVPLRREGLSAVRGIVHDESATHQTVFVEPPLAIDAMNRIAELEREESREVDRILRSVTSRLRPHARGLSHSLDALSETDSLFARARYALEHGGARPELVGAGPAAASPRYRASAAFHPLLRASGVPAVPFDLALGPDERVLLISGPNAGGKTVLLKAIGLLSAMAQSGIIPPAAAGTRLPLFGAFFAIIGDEQSIQASLSTFGAQMRSLRVILEEADADALVLIDEVGGNTDPAEGSALAGVVLLRLAEQAGLTVATTHLGELKELAAEERAIVNASLQFDTEHLRPTYRLMRDRPGRSYALEIAGRLGLPESLLAQARGRLPMQARSVDRLLSDLESRGEELRRLEVTARADADRLRELEERLGRAERRLDRRERELEEQAVGRVERYLLEARREVAEVIDALTERARAVELDAEQSRLLDAAVAAARARVESALRDARGRRPQPESAAPGCQPEPDDHVRSRSLGLEGRVVEVRDDQVVVEARGMRVRLPSADLESLDPRQPSPPADRSEGSRLPEVEARPEVDLRGLRVEEVEAALAPCVDAAIVADLPSLRVIHGKGTGAVRAEVRRLLREDPRVLRFRPGAFDEGGSGVTVVEFTDGSD